LIIFPQNLELVLASRSEPPLPLARMRAGGDLVEIDAQRLSFTEQEADLLLNDLNGLGLDFCASLCDAVTDLSRDGGRGDRRAIRRRWR
jgi:ATP/maltotriose-dependent transcriptional regulator MalT